MKIQYCSDLHLEFPENKSFLKQNPIAPVGEILILAGDIVLFAVMQKHDDFFNYLSDHFQATYWIPGNHEYYYFDISKKSGILNEKIKTNVFLVNNISVIQKDVKFIFSTLWSHISPPNELPIKKALNDFHLIKNNGSSFSPEHYNLLHDESLEFIKQELTREKTGKTIVVTHHVPTFMNYPEKYKGDVLNEAFAVELFDLIENDGPDFWIYGHHHHNEPPFEIGKTKMLTNQLGYVSSKEHQYYQNDRIFNL